MVVRPDRASPTQKMTRDDSQERAHQQRLAQLGALFAGFAHEVRNPLSTIGLNLQLIEEDYQEAETPRDKRTLKRVKVLESEVARLQVILEEFLSFARKPDLQLQPTDLNGMLQDLVDFHSTEMREKGISLRFFPLHGIGRVLVDPAQLRAAVVNLVKNAFEACAEGDEVLVALRKEGRDLVIRVTDTGPGMAPEVQQKAFEPYFSTKRSGTGLGLPTVRRIAEDHGGRLELTSEVGKGTQFALRLPLTESVREGGA